ncbi:MAG: small basic protein [bacterium]|nr:small basic protein [bacterium]
MSLDKSLRSRASLARHRNVLKRAERIEALKSDDRWEEDQSPVGLPKIANRKAKVGKKIKEVKADTGEEATGEKSAPASAS